MPHCVFNVPPLHRSFEQQPLAHVAELHKAEPPPLPPPLVLELPLVLVPLDEDDALVEPLVVLPTPPDPPPGSPPWPPLEWVSRSPPVAQAASAKPSMEKDFFIWAPWGPRRC